MLHGKNVRSYTVLVRYRYRSSTTCTVYMLQVWPRQEHHVDAVAVLQSAAVYLRLTPHYCKYPCLYSFTTCTQLQYSCEAYVSTRSQPGYKADVLITYHFEAFRVTFENIFCSMIRSLFNINTAATRTFIHTSHIITIHVLSFYYC